MRTLEGVYKAVCLGVDNQGEVIRCQVPQIFNDETVTCFDVAGGVFPIEGDEGWVLFEAGYPDHPIWLAASEGISSPDVTPGVGVIDVSAGVGIAVTPGQHPVVTNMGVLSVVAGARVTINNTNAQVPVVTANPQYAAGGALDTLLAKNSAADYDTKWVTPTSLGFVAKAGDTMTGRLWVEVGNAPAVSVVGTGVHMEWWTNGRAARTGYFQGNSNGLLINSETGSLGLAASTGTVNLNNALNVGVSGAHGAGYNGLHWGSNYIIMSANGGDTLVTAGSGSGVSIRGGYNNAYQLNINSNGNHGMVGNLDLGGYQMSAGQFNTGGLYYISNGGGGWSMSDTIWIRAYNNKAIYTAGEIRGGHYTFDAGAGYVFTNSSDTDTGLYYDGDGQFRFISQGTAPMQWNANVTTVPYPSSLHLYSAGDSNHLLQYSNGTPAYSGDASNGPQLVGYGTVWLHTMVGGYGGPYGWDAFLSPNGHLFISPGCGFYNFSSREFKDNITSLDPSECLEQVRRWRPVEYDQDVQEDDALVTRHSTGFITEEMVHVTPTAVNVTGPDNERPGWANAMNYPSLTVQLTGAVQALLQRVKVLEDERSAA